jgi:transcriptional antiterminator RfaH
MPNNMNWFAVYTRPRQEDRVEKNLSRAFEVFNPLLKRRRLARGNCEQVVQPLFPCYVFARFEPGIHYHMVKYTRGVRGIVGPPGLPWPVSEEILRIIRGRMDSDGYVTVRPDLVPGDRVEITDTSLRGFAGIFENEMKASDRVIVLLNTIEYQARVEIEREFLRKI